jgi:hypothetical protein
MKIPDCVRKKAWRSGRGARKSTSAPHLFMLQDRAAFAAMLEFLSQD